MSFKQWFKEKFIDVSSKLKLLDVLGFFNGKAQATPAEMDLIQLFVLLSFRADFIFSLFNLLLTQAAVINV